MNIFKNITLPYRFSHSIPHSINPLLASLVLASNSVSGAEAGGSWDPGFGITFDQQINTSTTTIQALEVTDTGRVLIGGTFTRLGPYPAVTEVRNIACWNGMKWDQLDGGVNGSVRAILAVGTNVYVGGSFSRAGQVDASNLARWDGDRWWSVGGGVSGGNVERLVQHGDQLFVAGSFTAAGSIAANRIAAWDGSSWATMEGGVSGTAVTALMSTTDGLLVGGTFARAGGVEAINVARWDGQTWSTIGTGTPAPVTVFARDSQGRIFAGGGSQFASPRFIQYWDAGQWRGMDLQDPGNHSSLSVLYTEGTNVFAGGIRAPGPGGVAGITRWDGTNWVRITTEFYPVSVGPVKWGDRNYFAGMLNDVASPIPNQQPRGVFGVAYQEGTNWSTLQSGINPMSPYASTIRSLTFDGPRLLVAGLLGGTSFRPVREHVAEWNGQRWSTLGSAAPAGALTGEDGGYGVATLRGTVYLWNQNGLFEMREGVWSALPVAPGLVHALHAGADELLVGTSAGVARLVAGQWVSIGGAFNGPVHALTTKDTEIFAGGAFTTAGGVPATNIARWNGTQWEALGEGIDGPVFSLALRGQELVAGGSFSNAGGRSASSIAVWRVDRWESLGSGVFLDAHGDQAGWVRAMGVASNGTVYAAGQFQRAGGVTVRNIAVWDGQKWADLGTGTDGTVNALALGERDVYLGGSFVEAGGIPSARIARWDPGTDVPPTLSIQQFPDFVVLAWPSAGGGWTLESSLNLSPPHWQPEPSSEVSGVYYSTNQLDKAARYFRLR